MTMAGRNPDDTDTDTDTETSGATPTFLEQIGGWQGFVYSTIPVVVFVTANAFLPLWWTIGIALGSGVALFGYRLVRGARVAQAAGSVLGVAVASAVVAWTGSARDFFAIGIVISLVGFLVFAGSVLVRRPLTGVAWNLVHGGRHPWRTDRPSLRAHDIATLAIALVFGARVVVQQWLYFADSTTGLGIARIAMGTPLSVVSVVITVWALRCTTKRLVNGNR